MAKFNDKLLIIKVIYLISPSTLSLTYSNAIIFVLSVGCIYTLSTWQTLITLITLIIKSFFFIWTNNVNGPLAALNFFKHTVIILYCCITQVVSTHYLHAKHWLHWLHWLQSRFTIWTDNFNVISLTMLSLTYNYNIVLLYSTGCIHKLSTCQTLITLITLIIKSFFSSGQITYGSVGWP